MWDAVLGRFKLGVEDFAGVTAGEMAGFGDGVKDLGFSCAVDREIVDRFMGDGIFFNIRGRRKHVQDSFGVGDSDWFSLISRISASARTHMYTKQTAAMKGVNMV